MSATSRLVRPSPGSQRIKELSQEKVALIVVRKVELLDDPSEG